MVSEEKITTNWLLNHVPVTWFIASITLLSGAFGLGYTLKNEMGSASGTPTAKEVVELQKQKDELEAKILTLKVELSRLKVAKKVEGMSDEEVAEALKKYQRN